MRGSAVPDLVIWVCFRERKGERENGELKLGFQRERGRWVEENGELNFS